MKRIDAAKLRKWVLLGLALGTGISLLSGMLLTCDWGGLLLNVGAEFGGALATYVLIELFIRRREEEEVKKADLIAQMGSNVKDVAIAAAEELARQGWLRDGSLQGAFLADANLEGAFLTGANLEGARLQDANLQGANLLDANLQGAILVDANLQGANLRRTDLQEAHLANANLREANLREANLREAGLFDARLLSAILKGAILEGAKLKGAILTKGTILPDGTRWTRDTDMARFTEPTHPDFWRPDNGSFELVNFI